MTSDPDSSHLLPNLDFDLLPRYTGKHLDSLTCSSPHHHTMADLYTTVMGYTQLLFTLMCLISGLASMPFINLCIGGGSFAGTLVPLIVLVPIVAIIATSGMSSNVVLH